jgi:amino acid adenylation domain-containing protein
VVSSPSDFGQGEQQQLTYGELNQKANQLARYLGRIGVGPESLVGICVERSLETVLGVLGILKAGGAYVPFDPAYPAERLAYMVKDSQIQVLLTQQHLVEHLTDAMRHAPCALFLFDADWETIAAEEDENPGSGVSADNLAYVIYTSGSTGKPKGVMIQHRSALNLANALHRTIYAPREKAELRLSLNAPLPFDASVQQLVMLLFGHTLHVIPQDVRLDGEALLAFLRQNRLDAFDCVPSQLKLLLEAGFLTDSEWVPWAGLPGGEAIDTVTWQKLKEAPATEFYNMYGPTECTVDSTICRVSTACEQPTIGRPASNAQFYVLDCHLKPVPIGVSGELHIGGAGVGRGYHNRPELTAEKFIPNPFSNEMGARLYKTGDLVRYLPDGNLEFLGRIDHQEKIRGFRIELGEITETLKQHPNLQEAVVMAREDRPGDKRLAAYVVPENKTVPNINELRNFLQQKLPVYMVPSAFVMMEALPLTPNGKLDQRALPAPEQNRPDSEIAYVEPRTQMEERLAEIWKEVLGVDLIGVFDNFFQLGGHSLLATQVISRVRDSFQVQLPVRDLFQASTIAGLAEKIDALQWITASTDASCIDSEKNREEGEL